VSDDAKNALDDAMAEAGLLPADPEQVDLVDAPTSAKLMAPIIALGATWAVREIMEKVYKKTTGNNPPHASDPEQTMTRVILWAATTAAAVAIVSVSGESRPAKTFLSPRASSTMPATIGRWK